MIDSDLTIGKNGHSDLAMELHSRVKHGEVTKKHETHVMQKPQ